MTQRACSVLQNLQPSSNATTNCEGLDQLVTGALQRRDYAASDTIAPHVARQVSAIRQEPDDGPATAKKGAMNSARTASIRTSLRARLQRFAVQALQTHWRELSGRHVVDGALVVLNNVRLEVRVAGVISAKR